MSWEKFDENRAANAKPRSADKLAESVKSGSGDAHAADGGIRRGEGGVVHKAVESRPVVARRVTKPVKKAIGPAAAKKSTAPTAAARLVEDRDTRAKAHYDQVAARANKASDEAKDAEGHTEAYRQHMHAANVAPNETLRQMHMKVAVSHDRANVYEKGVGQRAESLREAQSRAGQAVSPVHKSTQAEQKARADKTRADYLASKAHIKPMFEGKSGPADMKKADAQSAKAEASTARGLTKDEHMAAYKQHDEIAKSMTSGKTRDDAGVVYHANLASYHYHAAKGDRPEPGIVQEHKDSTASRFENSESDMRAGHNTDENRAASEKNYKSVTEVKKTGATPEELASLKAYTKGSDSVINDHLRTGGKNTNATGHGDIAQHVANIDSLFDRQKPLEHDLTTYRGVGSKVDEMFGPVGSRVGHEFTDHGYSSTSTHANIAAGFGRGALLRVLSPAGSKVVNPAGAGGFGRKEREVLMPSHSSYHVAADRMVRRDNGEMQRQIDLIRKA